MKTFLFKNNTLGKLLSVLLVVGLILYSCKKKKEDPALDNGNFDRGAMLQNFASNIIRPAYNDLKTSTDALKGAIDALTGNVNETNLIAAQEAWDQAYTNLQYVNFYNFGPGGEEGTTKGLTEEIAVYPANTTGIETRISDNNTDFNNFARDTRGFLALDYLLFEGGNSAVVADLANANRRTYLVAVAAHMQSKVNAVVNGWASYEAGFVSNTGIDAGSSMTEFYNAFLIGYEELKNYKVGLPGGLRAGQTSTEPEKVAGYYSGEALKYMKIHFDAVEQLWYGKTKSGQDGLGFDDYLSAVEGGEALKTQTLQQMQAVKNALNAVPSGTPFQDNVGDSKVSDLYTALSAFTRYLKSDLSSLLGLYITYSSGDGD